MHNSPGCARRNARLCAYGLLCLSGRRSLLPKKQSQKMAGVNALKAAGLPACRLNHYVDPPLIDDVQPIHMIITTQDRFDTCFQKQTVQKQGTAQFRTGVLKLDLSAAFDRLRLELGEAASELDDLEAMAIDADVQP